MSAPEEFAVANRRVTVVGAARSGIAAAELLARRGAAVTLSDLRESIDESDRARLIEAGVELELGGHQPATFTQADLIVTSPGVPSDLAELGSARLNGVPVIGEVELAFRWLRGRVIAVTGTKGKSTTTTLIGEVLRKAGFAVTVGGNIGAPLTAQVDVSTPETFHVVEVSSFQLEQIDRFRPWIAVMLNFSPDHLDRHGTVEAYASAKARVFENQESSDWAVVNADDRGAQQLAAGARATPRLFSRGGRIEEGVVVEAGWIVDRKGSGASGRTGGATDRLIPLSSVHLLGPHLVDDVLAAATVGAIAGASASAMTSAVDGFRGLEHAMELVATIGDVRFVNDSKATNVEAAVRSIESFDRGVVAVVGGRYKGGDLRLLRGPMAQRGTAVVAIGEAAGMVGDALSDLVTVERAETMRDAVERAFALAEPGGVVVLAPACASFDMFRDYAERGRSFKDAVMAIATRDGDRTRTRER